MATNKELAEKYPVKHSRDGGGMTLGDLVRKFANYAESLVLTSPLARDKLGDWLDREFLFGTWGIVMGEVRERNFGRDINGFIVEVWEEGLLRGRVGPDLKKPENQPAVEWCWREKDAEVAHGPFSSREEAIAEAKAQNDWSRTVMIGRCVYPDPVFTAGQVTDMDYLLEQMDEHAYDNEYPFDDSVFDISGGSERHKAAQEGLKQALMAWAKEFIDPPTSWHTSEQEEEEVEINPEDRPVCHCGEYCDEHGAGSSHTPVPMERPEADDEP